MTGYLEAMIVPCRALFLAKHLTRAFALDLSDRTVFRMSQFQNVPLWPIFSLSSTSFAMTSGVGLKFQSSIPMESGLTVEIFARLDLDQTETF